MPCGAHSSNMVRPVLRWSSSTVLRNDVQGYLYYPIVEEGRYETFLVRSIQVFYPLVLYRSRTCCELFACYYFILGSTAAAYIAGCLIIFLSFRVGFYITLFTITPLAIKSRLVFKSVL